MSLLDVLGSKSRLKIIRALSHEPKYVTELAEEVGVDGKTAVHHLTALENAGLVEPQFRGNRKYYRLVRTVTLRARPPPERTFIVQANGVADEATGTGDDAGEPAAGDP